MVVLFNRYISLENEIELENTLTVINALCFEDPFPSYATIAARLGLSSNSIGFTRDRCLERLGNLLEDLGYEK